MVDDLMDIIASLTAIMEEETDRLALPGPFPDLAELVGAKVRLAARLEMRIAERTRATPEWLAALGVDDRARIAAAMRVMHEAARINAEILERHITLAGEMMAAVSGEVQRLIGARNATYGSRGALRQLEQGVPIAVNARL